MAVAASMMVLAGCSNDGGIGRDVDAGSITIDATIGHMTKVMYDADATSFTSGDAILLYGWTGSATEVPQKRVVDSVTCSFNGTKWTPSKQMLWKNTADAHYFLGIYPVPDSVTSFTAAAYKLNSADYTASDLLIATTPNGVKATGAPVNLTFEHTMAKLNVNIKFRNEFDGTPVVSSVTATAHDSAMVNYLTKQVSVAGDVTSVTIPQAATAANGYALSYSGLMVPQEGVRIITVTIGEKRYEYESTADIPLSFGKYTTLGLIVGKNKIELDGVTVSDWTTGDNLPGGEAKLFDPYNGHEYVDLGLPSGLKWATCNVGATKPEEYGDYFAWGDTVPYYKEGHSQDNPCSDWKDDKDGYTWTNYRFRTSGDSWNNVKISKYNTSSTYGPIDSKTTLDPEDDAASYNWGGIWRMPTKDDYEELFKNCATELKKQNGVYGLLFTSNKNGATLFLPAAGYRLNADLNDVGSFGRYWFSSLYTDYPITAWITDFNSSIMLMNINRNYGLSVRPVCQ